MSHYVDPAEQPRTTKRRPMGGPVAPTEPPGLFDTPLDAPVEPPTVEWMLFRARSEKHDEPWYVGSPAFVSRMSPEVFETVAVCRAAAPPGTGEPTPESPVRHVDEGDSLAVLEFFAKHCTERSDCPVPHEQFYRLLGSNNGRKETPDLLVSEEELADANGDAKLFGTMPGDEMLTLFSRMVRDCRTLRGMGVTK